MITEQLCDSAFKSIRFNKNSMETMLSLIESHWVSKLYVFNPFEAKRILGIMADIRRLVYYRQQWGNTSKYRKKELLGFLIRNHRLFTDNKAYFWKNIELYNAFYSVGNSNWDVRIE